MADKLPQEIREMLANARERWWRPDYEVLFREISETLQAPAALAISVPCEHPFLREIVEFAVRHLVPNAVSLDVELFALPEVSFVRGVIRLPGYFGEVIVDAQQDAGLLSLSQLGPDPDGWICRFVLFGAPTQPENAPWERTEN